MNVWDRVITLEQDRALTAAQRGVLSMLAIVESFFDEVGEPLTHRQLLALRAAEAEIRVNEAAS